MKNNRIYIYCLVLLAGVILCSCNKEQIHVFDEAPALNLQTPSDTISLSFDFVQTNDTTFIFPVRVVGYPVDYDRKVKVAIGKGSNATAGVNFDVEDCIIKANTVSADLKCVIYKTDDVTETVFKYVTLIVEPSEEFKDVMVSTVTLVLKRGLPSVWSEEWISNYYCDLVYGAYSKEKLRFIMKELGTSDVVKIASNTSAWSALKLFLNTRLQVYETLIGKTYVDENGVQITFPN